MRSVGPGLDSLRGAGLAVEAFPGVRGEPTLGVVAEGIALARRVSAEVLIGLGGGSAMDTAKAVAGLAPLTGEPEEYFAGRAIDGAPLPWVAVPTTSGTGAEVTMNAVLTDEAAGAKKSIRSASWFARCALVDPALTLSLPPAATAHSGADALTQALESSPSVAMPSGSSGARCCPRTGTAERSLIGATCTTAA